MNCLRCRNLRRSFRKASRRIEGIASVGSVLVADFNAAEHRLDQVEGDKFVVKPNGRLKMCHKHSQKQTDGTEDQRDVGMSNFGLKCDPTAGRTYEFVESSCNKSSSDITTLVEFHTKEVRVFKDHIGGINLWVWRIGNLDGPLECDWALENGCLPDPCLRTIPHLKGTIRFEHGEECTSALLQLGDTRKWTWFVDCFFVVKLIPRTSTLSSGRSFAVGRDAGCQVWVMNKQIFPLGLHDRRRGLITLMCAFWCHNFYVMPLATVVGLLAALIPAILNFCYMFMLQRLVDCTNPETCRLFGLELGEDWDWTPMFAIGLFYAALLALDFLRAYVLRNRRLGGRAARKLRANLFSMMLQLDTSAWANFDHGEIPRILNNDVASAIDAVWLGGFRIFTRVFELIIKYTIIERVLQQEHGQEFLQTICRAGVLLMLVVVAVELTMTHRKYFLLDEQRTGALANWHAFVEMCEDNLTAINAFGQHGVAIVSADEAHGRINKAFIQWEDFTEMSKWRAKGLFQLMFVAVVVTMGRQARQGYISPGCFVVVLRSTESFAKTLDGFMTDVVKLLSGGGAVEKIATVLNKDTTRRRSAKHRQQKGISSERTPEELHMNQVEFRYPYSQEKAIHPLKFRVKPGQIVCIPKSVSGHSSAGVNTLFRLIAGELQPLAGSVDMPDRWRVSYISNTPVLFDGTLMYNLCYPRSSALCDGHVDLVWKTCHDVGLSPRLIGCESFDVGSNGTHLGFTDRIRVTLVRALLHDVDVLLIASLMDIIGFEKSTRLMSLLRSYIEQRGLPGVTRDIPRTLSHEKTVVFSSVFDEIQQLSDTLLTVGDTGLLQRGTHDSSSMAQAITQSTDIVGESAKEPPMQSIVGVPENPEEKLNEYAPQEAMFCGRMAL
eukprot:TRINITY_DN15723_c0_g2_i1.p1 TRINITY_DN15723_c0_g2~~TRINITY_DN15723_c0_g2_i1.p1  ORF type:complete len:891 (-),score=95.66 TRINITY_DN15723_c0_g2_i1:140-2812(-)